MKGCGRRPIPGIIPARAEGRGVEEHRIKLTERLAGPDLNPRPSKYIGMDLMELIAGKFHVVWNQATLQCLVRARARTHTQRLHFYEHTL